MSTLATSSLLPPPLSPSSLSPLLPLSPPSSPASRPSTTLPRSQMCSRQTCCSIPATPPLPLPAPRTPLPPPISSLLFATPLLPSALLSIPTCTSRTLCSLLLLPPLASLHSLPLSHLSPPLHSPLSPPSRKP